MRLCASNCLTKYHDFAVYSLFSKWFSESGKLVQKMFSEIRDLIEVRSKNLRKLIFHLTAPKCTQDFDCNIYKRPRLLIVM